MKDLLKLKKRIILASKSPRRKNLMRQLGLNFTVIESGIDEKAHSYEGSPPDYAKQLALKKANDVAEKVNEPAIVIGADTIVVINGKILNKPKDSDDARAMLGTLSGNTHTVYTGVAVIDTETKKQIVDVKATNVTFRQLDESEITAYVETGSPLDKAGAYGIQDDFGAVFISHIEGCYYNIVGLPLELLYSMLKRL